MEEAAAAAAQTTDVVQMVSLCCTQNLVLRGAYVVPSAPTSYAQTPGHECACLSDRKLEITVYQFVKICIFLTLTHGFALEGLY